MKRLLVVPFLLLGLASCKFAAKEVKKVAKISKAVKSACDCRGVNVVSDYDPNGAILNITIDDFEGDNLAETSDSIVTRVKGVFPNLCNHEEVNVIYEGDDYDIEYSYIGCDLKHTVDTTFWDYDEFEEFEGFEEEEEEEEEEETEASTNKENVKDIEDMIEELEALKEKMEDGSN